MPAAIEVRDLSKIFAPRRARLPWRRQGLPVQALDGVTFEVERGQVAALLGENGAGKTTLLKILCTVVSPERGSARVQGHDLELESDAVRAVVGYVTTDDRSFYWRLSARENLAFFAALGGRGRRESLIEVDRVLEIVGLKDAAARRVSNLSSGMRQRLGIARALIGEPQVLLLDEPTRSLDPGARQHLEAELLRMARDLELTLFFATHDLAQARRLAGTALVLKRGRLAGIVPLKTRDQRCWRIHRSESGPPFPSKPGLAETASTTEAEFVGRPGDLVACLLTLRAAGVTITDLRERENAELERLLGIGR